MIFTGLLRGILWFRTLAQRAGVAAAGSRSRFFVRPAAQAVEQQVHHAPAELRTFIWSRDAKVGYGAE